MVAPARPRPSIEGGAVPARSVPTRRVEFSYPPDQLPKYFMGGEPAFSHLMAVLSALFPEGEDFFVRSVRRYRDEITDPELKRQVAGFIGQEAIHGREHRAFNLRLAELGYPTRAIDRGVKYGLGALARVLPRWDQVAVTAALEHYTATLAERILTDPEISAVPSSDEVRYLLLWHALEESEHKSVAFDVLASVRGVEWERILTMRITTAVFLAVLVVATAVSMLMDGDSYRHPIRALRSVTRLRHPWLGREVVGRIAAYNRKGFHPDDHDATEAIEAWRARLFGDAGELTDRLKRGTASLRTP